MVFFYRTEGTLGTLGDFHVPSNIKYISDRCFEWVKANIIYIDGDLEYLGESAFVNSEVCEIYLPRKINYLAISAFDGLLKVVIIGVLSRCFMFQMFRFRVLARQLLCQILILIK